MSNNATKQMIAEFDEESKDDDLTQKIVGLLGIHGVAVRFEFGEDGSHITKKIVEVVEQEVAKERDRIASLCYQLDTDGEKMYQLIYKEV